MLLLVSGLGLAQTYHSVSGKFENFNPGTDGDIEVLYVFTGERLEYEINTAKIDSTGFFEFQVPKLHQHQIIRLQISKYIITDLLVTSDLHLELDVDKTYYGLLSIKPHVRFVGPTARAAKHFVKYSNRFSSNRPMLVNSKGDSMTLPAYIESLYKHHGKAVKGLPDSIAQILNEQFEFKARMEQHYSSTSNRFDSNDFQTVRPNEYSPYYLQYLSNVSIYAFGYDTKTHIKITKDVVYSALDSTERLDFNQYLKIWKNYKYGGGNDSLFKLGRARFYSPNELVIFKKLVSNFRATLLKYDLDYKNDLIVMNMPKTVEKRKIYLDSLRQFISEEWANNIVKNIKNQDIEAEHIVNGIQDTIYSMHSLGQLIYQNDSVALYINDYETSNHILANIHNMFPDKIVVVDIWTTWCGPCILDMKASRENKKDLSKNGIIVVYLCDGSNSDVPTWVQKVKGIGATGHHIFINKPQREQLFSEFGFTGYPSYLVIGPDGYFHSDLVKGITPLKARHLIKKVQKTPRRN